MDELEQLIRSSQSNHTVKLIQSYKSSASFLLGKLAFPYKGTAVPRQETSVSDIGNARFQNKKLKETVSHSDTMI